MCSIEDNERYHKSIYDEKGSGGSIPLSYNSTKYTLISFGLTINLNEIRLK